MNDIVFMAAMASSSMGGRRSENRWKGNQA